eukprot:scaffold56886_cov31-Phaeocystis_antarctica.AAC.1
MHIFSRPPPPHTKLSRGPSAASDRAPTASGQTEWGLLNDFSTQRWSHSRDQRPATSRQVGCEAEPVTGTRRRHRRETTADRRSEARASARHDMSRCAILAMAQNVPTATGATSGEAETFLTNL